MPLKPKATVKKKTKEQRCREHALTIYASLVSRVGEIVQSAPVLPQPKEINKMLQNRFNLAVEAAEIFESNWGRVSARFKEDTEDDD
jgi:hypothetical protein